MTNVSTCYFDVDTNLRMTISIYTYIHAYNGTVRFLRITDFCILNSEDFRTLDLQMFCLWFLDFQISRFPDF